MLHRRTLLGAGIAGALGTLTGCAHETATTSPASSASSSGSFLPATTASRTPSATGSASASATTTPSAAVPTRAQIVAEFGSLRPKEWGLHSSGTVNRGTARATRKGLVALTFDACGGKGGSAHDAELIALLRRLRVPATLMLNARWITENPAIARNLGADPLFEIGSHGMRHLPLSVSGRVAYGSTGTLSVGEVYDELTHATPTVESISGRPVRWFRPGTAYSDEVAAAIARRLGTPVVDFSVNGDAGTTFTAGQIDESVGAVLPGDIVISHMNHPEHQTAEGYARVLPRLLRRGVRFAHLSDVA